MSLDVYLTGTTSHTKPALIPVRENGGTARLTREEWDERNPGREPVVLTEHETDEVYSANITHNLRKMAAEAGIYQVMWRPDEIGITKADQLIKPLSKGLALLRAEPARFVPFNPLNGWGNYEGLVQFVTDYLAACETNPDADVSVWR